MSNKTLVSFRLSRADVVRPAIILGSIVGLMWVIEAIDWITGPFLVLDAWGIQPRNVNHLSGILFAPFLHADFSHLVANSVPFLILGALVFFRGEREFWQVTLLVTLVAGLGTWLIGPRFSVHVGASGVVFGYLGFLILLGWFERSPASILRALAVGLVYGGVLWGVLPFQDGISWQGHLFGFLAGALAAAWFGRRPRNLDREIKIY